MKGLLLFLLLVAVLSLSATSFEPATSIELTSETVTQNDAFGKAIDAEEPGAAVQTSSLPQRTDRTWDGSSSSAWNNSANWTPAGIPVAGDAVTIPQGATPYPIITSAVNAACTSVSLASGASLNIQGTLSLSGGFTNYGSISLFGSLTTGLDIYEYGNLNFTSELAELTINDDLRLFSGGSITFLADLLSYPDITVKGDLIFNTGSSLNLTHGKIVLSGTTQNIYTYAAATLYGLEINSTSCTFAAASTQALTVSSTFQILAGKAFYGNADVTTYLKGYISNGTGAVMQFNAGTVSLSGTASANVSTQSINYFNHLEINKSGTAHVLLNSDISVYGNLTITSGALWPAHDVYVRNGWTNNVGTSGFDEDYSTAARVIFYGPNTQHIYTDETFNILVQDKTGGMLSVPPGSEVTCLRYLPTTPNIGILYVTGIFNVTWSNSNAFALGNVSLAGTINYQHNTGYALNIGANIIINGGAFHIYGATEATLNSPGSLYMDDGELNFHDANVTIQDGFNTTLIGGYLRVAHNLTILEPDFNPTMLMTYLYGDYNSTLSVVAGAQLDNLKIIKGDAYTVTASSDIHVTGVLHVERGTFDTHYMDITVDTYTIIYGTLYITYDTTFAQGGEFVVAPGGKLKTWGIDANNAIFTRSGTGYYTFTVQSGGTISAIYTIFEYMNVGGINLQEGSMVEVPYSFQHCTFRNGASTGTLLTINNNQELAIYDVYFPSNTWGGSWSVSKQNNQGRLSFYRYLVGMFGPAYEHDAFGTIDWYLTTIPPVTDLTISPDPDNVNLVELNWTYPISGARFNLFSSDQPYNNFTYAGYSISYPVALATTAKKFFYITVELEP